MPYVRSYRRKTPSGKTTVVKGHHRKDTIRKVPVRTNNSSVEAFAQYDVLNKQTHIAVVDNDKNRLTTVTKNEPFEAEEVIVEEQPAALNIIVKDKKKVKGKNKRSRTVINITDLL